MRKWVPYGSYRNPGAWTRISDMIATDAGTYRTPTTFDVLVASGPATPGTTLAAWCGLTFSGAGVGYVGTTTKLYTFTTAGTFTDKSKGGGYTNTATDWQFEQYGNVTIATNNVNPPQFRDASGAGAFADLAAAPSTAKIVCAQSNCVLFFNTVNGGAHYTVSDVGDYTNYSTGDAVADNFIAHRPGDITAAIAFKDDVIVFKSNSVYRMTYVGGPIKWTVSLLAEGIGCPGPNDAVVCGDKIIFGGETGAYSFDGASFRDLMPGWSTGKVLGGAKAGIYWPKTNTVWFAAGGSVLPYNITSDAWGKFNFYLGGGASSSSISTHSIVRGSPAARLAVLGSISEFDTLGNAQVLVNLSSATQALLSGTKEWSTNVVDAYVQTNLYGSDTGTTLFTRVTPQLVRAGAPDVSSPTSPTDTGMRLTYTPYDGPDGSGQGSGTFVTSSTARNRFDFTLACNYAIFTVRCYTAYFEIEDVVVASQPAGAN